MTNQEIFDLIACFDRSSAQTMRLSLQDFTIELTRGGARVPEAAAAPAGGAEPLEIPYRPLEEVNISALGCPRPEVAYPEPVG